MPSTPNTEAPEVSQSEAQRLALIDRLKTDVQWHQRRGNDTIAADLIEAISALAEQASGKGGQSVRMWHDRIKDAHPTSDPQYWPSSLKVEYMEQEILDLRAIASGKAQQAAEPSPMPSISQRLAEDVLRISVLACMTEKQSEILRKAAIALDEQAHGSSPPLQAVNGKDLCRMWWDAYAAQPDVECMLPVWSQQDPAINAAWERLAGHLATPPETPAAQQAVGSEPWIFPGLLKGDVAARIGNEHRVSAYAVQAVAAAIHKLYAHPPSDQASEKGDAE